MSYTYRRSATAHGIFKRSIVLLEHEAVSGSRIKYDTASYHILSFGQEGTYQKDITKGLMPEVKENEPLHQDKGCPQLLYIVMIVIAVILSGVLPKLSAFQNAAGEVIGIPIFREVTLTVPAIIEIAIILLAALLSLQDNTEGGSCAEPFHMGSNSGGCGAFHRNLHHHAACSYGIKECRFRSWNHKAV